MPLAHPGTHFCHFDVNLAICKVVALGSSTTGMIKSPTQLKVSLESLDGE
jgi:hypothetical protein